MKERIEKAIFSVVIITALVVLALSGLMIFIGCLIMAYKGGGICAALVTTGAVVGIVFAVKGFAKNIAESFNSTLFDSFK